MFSNIGSAQDLELDLVYDTALSSARVHVILNHMTESTTPPEWISEDRYNLLVSGDIDAWRKVIAEIPDEIEQDYVIRALLEHFPNLKAHISV